MPDVILIWSQECHNGESLLRSGAWTITRGATIFTYELRYDGVFAGTAPTPELAKEMATAVEKSKVNPPSTTDFAEPGLKVFITKPATTRLGVTVGAFRPDVAAGVFLYSVDTGASIEEFPASQLAARQTPTPDLIWNLDRLNDRRVYRSGPWTIEVVPGANGDRYDIQRNGLPVTTVYDLGVAKSLAQHIGTQHLDEVRPIIDRVTEQQHRAAITSAPSVKSTPRPCERAEGILMAEIERLRLRCLELEALRLQPLGAPYADLSDITDFLIENVSIGRANLDTLLRMIREYAVKGHQPSLTESLPAQPSEVPEDLEFKNLAWQCERGFHTWKNWERPALSEVLGSPQEFRKCAACGETEYRKARHQTTTPPPTVLGELYEDLNQVTDYEAGFTSARIAYIAGQRSGLQRAVATVIRAARAGAPLENPDDEANTLSLIDERDEAQAWADLLAGVIASPEELGEYSNINNPLVNALEIARSRASERDRLASVSATLTRELTRVNESCDAALLDGNTDIFNRLNVARSAFSFTLQLLGSPNEKESATLAEEFTLAKEPDQYSAEPVDELLWEDYRTNSWSKFVRVEDLGNGLWRVRLRNVDVDSREAGKALAQAVKNTIDRVTGAILVHGGPLITTTTSPVPEVTPLVWDDTPTKSRNARAKIDATDGGWRVRLRSVVVPTRHEAKQLAAAAVSAISQKDLATPL